MLSLIKKYAAKVMRREPDFIIGGKENPYLRRWWIIPRNKYFNIYLHEIIRSDDDRALHDHPWWNCSIILNGSYNEVVPCPIHPNVHSLGHFNIYRRDTGSIVFRRPEQLHRLVIDNDAAITLFITGPVVRMWGFDCPKGWVPYKNFVAADDKGSIGKGCGE